ncbi:predicted protein [Botrytis cinerea T4]|uniref:Uncharacterized protein n=1 Tax=Botryotinia fuckeliana (strain T4) TaxID=999810 RepID=G2Y0I8_BOTF4|nr:predicted protein [Botrytis cinerea T4]
MTISHLLVDTNLKTSLPRFNLTSESGGIAEHPLAFHILVPVDVGERSFTSAQTLQNNLAE